MTEPGRGRLNRFVGAIVNPVVDSVRFDDVLENVDLDEVLARVDVNALLERVDVNGLLNRVDVDALLDRVDVDRLLDRVDVERLLARVEVNDLLDRADIDRLLQRTSIGSVVTESAGTVATSALDLGRRQLAGLDVVVGRVVDRLARRTVERAVDPGVVDDRPAGGVSRLAAYAVDSLVVTGLFGGGLAAAVYLINLLFKTEVEPTRSGGLWWAIAVFGFAAMYQWVCLVVANRTIGKALLGLRVARYDGSELRAGHALKRVLVFPVGFLFGVGFLGVLIGKHRRALHDVAAGTVVVYDWGSRVARVPAPLERFLDRRSLTVH